MIRWMRMSAVALVVLVFIAVGVAVGLLLVENGRGEHAWVLVEIHPWLQEILGQSKEAWLPALLAGWLVAALALGILLFGSLFYVWRRRRYEGLVRKLEHELIKLRNLPFDNPAPFEDEPELPSRQAREIMLAGDAALELPGGDSTGRRS